MEIDEYDDPLERLHIANRARILKGAKKGKYWLLKCEGEDMNEDKRDELIRKIIEMTTTANIGVVNMPFKFNKNDPALGGRNRFRDEQDRKTKKWYRSLRRSEG